VTTFPQGLHERWRRFRTPVVLLVEKEPAVREVIQDMVQGAGIEMLTAADAETALALGRNPERRVDLLLTESDPTGMRAPEMARLLYQSNPIMKIIFMSGKFDEGFAFMLGEQAERLFLMKPFTRKMLLEKIDSVLG